MNLFKEISPFKKFPMDCQSRGRQQLETILNRISGLFDPSKLREMPEIYRELESIKQVCPDHSDRIDPLLYQIRSFHGSLQSSLNNTLERWSIPPEANLFIRDLTGRVYRVHAQDNTTVLEVKQEIQREHNIPLENQTLVLGRRSMGNDELILRRIDPTETTAAPILVIRAPEVVQPRGPFWAKLNIKTKDYGTRSYEVLVNQNTIGQLKQILAQDFQTTIPQLSLIFIGRSLPDDQVITEDLTDEFVNLRID